MIDVKNLSKSFGNHLVLDNITEHISPGEKVVVIGPSGSGKSTFLRCLNLLETPTKGRQNPAANGHGLSTFQSLPQHDHSKEHNLSPSSDQADESGGG